MFTPAHKSFFDTFGYLVVPGLVRDRIGMICDEFEAVFRSRQDVVHDGSQRTMFPASFVDSSAGLCTLLDHPGIVALSDAMLGEGWAYSGGDGNLYAGDTGWHSDLIPVSEEGIRFKTGVLWAKIAFYLDPIDRESGALRVIPGSHRMTETFGRQLHERLQMTGSDRSFGIDGREVPSVALDSQPGDVVIFNHLIKHAAYGGGKRRRMFTMNLFERCRTEEQRELNRGVLDFYADEGCEGFFSETMLKTASPARMKHLEHALEFVPAMAARARAKKAREALVPTG
ncbi:MAG: phytanoyl-CoA dioxygenase family protein [Planctomycetes bacterium]|nr:phytanoyl-CoA dioxygenase family protein [Planctomycetota bacterium]